VLLITNRPKERKDSKTLYYSLNLQKSLLLKKNFGNLETRKNCIVSRFVLPVSSALTLLWYGQRCINVNGVWCVPSAAHVQREHQFQSTVFSRKLFVILFFNYFLLYSLFVFMSAVQKEHDIIESHKSSLKVFFCPLGRLVR
jgi:hypothetical protein